MLDRLPHEGCLEARRLLDSYLMALSRDDSLRTSSDWNRSEDRLICDELAGARYRYWHHVENHGCRKPEGMGPGEVVSLAAPTIQRSSACLKR